jgi:predicted nucleotidyltransferase
MIIDAAALESAVQPLREAVAHCAREPDDEQLRDGLIPALRVHYELCHKTLRRYLRETAAVPEEFERLPLADLIRVGNGQGLVRADWPVSRRFREVRGRTSHVYDARAALAMPGCAGGGGRASGISSGGRTFVHRIAASARMIGTSTVDLTPEQRRIVLSILAAELKAEASVRVFGSRTTGRARHSSDLDPAIDAGRQLSRDEAARLAEAFRDSDLPYRVDLVNWRTIGDDFRRLIAAERVPLHIGAKFARCGEGT